MFSGLKAKESFVRHKQSFTKIVTSAGLTFVVGLLALTAAVVGSRLVFAGDAGGNATSPAPSTATTASRPATTATPNNQTNRYVALGDSVAAGAGLPSIPNAQPRDERCDRSSEAYPYFVAQSQALALTHVACSGATATNLLLWQGVANAPNPSRQISYIFDGGQPELVTITAGANDARWLYFINKCRTSRCGPDVRQGIFTSSRTDTTIVNGLLEALQLKYDAFFAELSIRSNGTPPTVVVTGYYNPFSEQCLAAFPTVSAAELAWLQANVGALNQTIRQTVERYPNARFAAVDFSGHELCTAEPWVQGLQEPAPIHPTSQGQRVIAESILNSLR